ncbi:hypothetical protein KR100_02120 [Synechococcus sp. KORDI-100]|uniref:hypothetical protein n=1 Tax=Synechococcus sp. KORDI-100 TaxID=1280380 RepID=UPI0004E0A380|nr:hypothetical protein [Synechococcus sp. KORDI-100]AII42201.1 hypothetical protein KR100_02120 [Synechococcus sp. KORDI-100]
MPTSDQATSSGNLRDDVLLKRFLIALTVISAAGLSLCIWVQQQRSFLPAPDSEQGRALLLQYQELSHGFWLFFLLLACGYLINQIYSNARKETPTSNHSIGQLIENTLGFIRNNSIATLLFTIYGIAMISGTTYLYKDMFVWYPELLKGHLLNNFSLRNSFIEETMRRTDYRFFPLAHQDLHLLSWFSIHIKTWMLFSTAELIAIVLLGVKFIGELDQHTRAKSSTILLMTAIFLIHPSTGTAFFHVIYCERLLCLVFMLYVVSYLHYRKTNRNSAFFSTLLWALIGIYIKDIAILLFVVPPTSLWVWDAINSRLSTATNITFQSKQNHKLERWLCSFSALFITSYIILALIPGIYSAEEAYNQDSNHIIILDLRFYIFSLIAAARVLMVARKSINISLLDGINLSAFSYALALAITYEFDTNSYLALPIQLITTMNIGWAWTTLIGNRNLKTFRNQNHMAIACIAAGTVIGVEHIATQETFLNNAIEQKKEQSRIQLTYENLDQITRKIRESGDNVNIITNQDSRFSARRHLNRIPYHSLIEYVPDAKNFVVVDGANKGTLYIPKVGDLVANLDKSTDLLDPILNNVETQEIYRHDVSKHTGLILRITDIES